MHELAVAQAVLDVALEAAAGRRVTRVELRVGALRQVVPAALAFSFELVARGTPADGAVLAIEPVPVVGRCRACGVESEQHGFPLRCAACGRLALEIVRGQELSVEWLELEEAGVSA
ncbi:MAG: hydrogenase maturation nickel metallochaperone HypA [Gemmatimonadetes bacterium]|nr:hydrogenase maturation nickel metallochaperone HypA [Gemmatimonadota bacterium]